ncbi:MAG: ABC transporter substrate-binding protein [Deltaproteobacteria bacterium]|nr:ABC transporter substrate-binding protein [Deltaproteobacteria bacterium]MBW2633128.1 ABC transporter substrate-binding protein [Deltaproteobacteria bacterium]MBW2678350.1 ABC transporter substrate-binding protein [Deltaproteobacteria bacterium]
MKHLTKAGVALFTLALIIAALIITPARAIETGEIRVGYTAPFTGAAAEYGNNGWRGILLALKDINKEGISIGGKRHKIRIFKYDSLCTPDEGLSNVEKMISEDKVVAILGDHCSTVCSAIAPLCDQYQVPGITIECAVDSVTKPGHEFYFRMRPTVTMMIASVMPKIFKTFDARTAGFLVINDGYGKLFMESVTNELEWRDVKTVVKETFERGSTDYRDQLERIKRAKPDILFYVGTASEGATILTQAKLKGLMPRTKFIGSEEMGEMELPMRAGKDAVDGTYAISLWGKIPHEFSGRVKDSFNKPMHYAIIFGYDAMHVLARAIETAQSLDPVKIKNALQKTDYRALEGRIRFKNFDGYKNQSKFTPSMIRWKNGERVHLDIFLQWEN